MNLKFLTDTRLTTSQSRNCISISILLNNSIVHFLRIRYRNINNFNYYVILPGCPGQQTKSKLTHYK